MAESIIDKAVGARKTGNGSSSVRDCAGLRLSSSERSHGESDSIKTVAGDEPAETSSFNPGNVDKENTVLYLENVSQYLNYREIMTTLSPFGQISRIKTIYKTDTNNFYITFTDALSAYTAHSKLNNIKLAKYYLHSKVINHRNIRNSDDDFVPEPEFLTDKHPKRKQHNKLKPIYNLIIVEESHNALKVFEFLNKQIGSPKLLPEFFTRFGRNSYLVKVSTPGQGYMLRGQFKDFGDSGIIDIKPYDDYNGSKGKIYNSDLAKLTPEELLNRCPENVIDVTNIKAFDKITRTYVNTPAIILKFSVSTPPDEIIIGPFRMKVKEYTAIPRTCKNCLKYGHTKNVCNKEKLCFKCSQSHPEEDNNFCPNITKCFHCSGDHWTFNKDCPEYVFQKEVCNKAYTEKTSIKKAKTLLNKPNNSKSYAGTAKTPRTTRNQSTEPNQNSGNNTSFWALPLNTNAGTSSTAAATSTPSKTSSSSSDATVPTSSGSTASIPKSTAPTTTRSSGFISSTRSITSTVKLTNPNNRSTTSSNNRSNITTTSRPISTAEVTAASNIFTPSSSKGQSSDFKKNIKNKSSSLLNLTSIEDEDQNTLSTKFKIPKETASSSYKTKDDSSLKTSNRFSCFSEESEELESSVVQMETEDDHKRERKRKPEKTSEDLQSSLQSKKKIQLTDVEKQKVFKNSSSSSKPKHDSKDVSHLNKPSILKISKSKD